MLEKVVCPFYSVGQCKFKDQCLREHHKEDCKDSLCRRKGCPKRHRRPCRYGNICKIYNKDKSCEFRHYFIDLDKNNKTYESVTNQLKDSKELVLKLRLEILELEKLNKEKVLLIDDLSFKIANTVLPNDEETWYDCNETDQLKSDFSQLSSKYNELLSELAESKNLLKQFSIQKDKVKETVSCKHCNSQFENEPNLNIHIESDHRVKCKLCKLTFNSNTSFQKHEELSHEQSHTIIKDTLICKYCKTVYSDADALRKHAKNDHKIKCEKCLIIFKNQEAKNEHIWEDHPRTQ